MNRKLITYLPLILSAGLFAYFCYALQFTQDDAYISYRYVQNFLDGNGLVFNIGERVEGFTNFGWVIYLIGWGFVGLNYITVSKITGILCGFLIIFLSFHISSAIFDKEQAWFSAIVILLVGMTQSLAYWSVAGLETAAFAAATLSAVYCYLKRSPCLILAILLAVLLRPEGALVAGLLIVLDTIESKGIPRFTIRYIGIAFLLSLPYVGFKIFYYGGILPNPFYAKTGLSSTQLSNGWEYVFRYLSHYGFYGAGLLVPLLFYKRLSLKIKSVWLFTVLYTVYVLLVGGDVLKVHRFFIPVIPFYALLIVYSLKLLLTSIPRKSRQPVLLLIGIGLIGLTYFLPLEFVKTYHRREKAFTDKMAFVANQLKANDSTNFSVAVPTIGILGYELIGHEVIDMVGLTDSTIARHSEPPIEGMTSTWKEAKHNSAYLLSKAPDYILFSTGAKPSAPAEKALCLYPQFRDSYRRIGWYYDPVDKRLTGRLEIAFKKFYPIQGEFKPDLPVAVVEQYKLGLDNYSGGDHARALQHFKRGIQLAPDNPYIYLLTHYAISLYYTNQVEEGIKMFNFVLSRDSAIFTAQKEMYQYARFVNDSVNIESHKKWINILAPGYIHRLDSTITQKLKAFRGQSSNP